MFAILLEQCSKISAKTAHGFAAEVAFCGSLLGTDANRSALGDLAKSLCNHHILGCRSSILRFPAGNLIVNEKPPQ
jgi:hypothetical protein